MVALVAHWLLCCRGAPRVPAIDVRANRLAGTAFGAIGLPGAALPPLAVRKLQRAKVQLPVFCFQCSDLLVVFIIPEAPSPCCLSGHVRRLRHMILHGQVRVNKSIETVSGAPQTYIMPCVYIQMACTGCRYSACPEKYDLLMTGAAEGQSRDFCSQAMPRQLTAHRAKTAPKPWTHSLQKRTTSLPSSPLTACQGLLQRQRAA